jgi:site-specific recombinase XerD
MQLLTHTAQFLIYLRHDLGRSQETVESYGRYLDTFLEQSRVTNPAKITQATVVAFSTYLAAPMLRPDGTHGTRTTRTQDYYRIALRSFLKYLAARGVATLPYQQVALSNQAAGALTQLLSMIEVERLRQSITGNSLSVLRDRAIIEVLLATGVRVAELAALMRQDCNLKTGICVVVHERYGERSVPLTPAAKHALLAYSKKRTDSSDSLFIQYGKNAHNTRNLVLSPRSIERMLVARGVAAGITTPVTPKALRQYVVAMLLHEDVALDDVQQQLGHQHVGSTKAMRRRVL